MFHLWLKLWQQIKLLGRPVKLPGWPTLKRWKRMLELWYDNGIGGTKLNASGIGTIPVHSYVRGERRNGEFHYVPFVPGLGTNLFSIGIATDSGKTAHFIKDTVAFVKNGIEIMSGCRVGKSLYHLKVIAKNSDQENIHVAAANTTHPITIWHQRLANLNCKSILKMAKSDAVVGLDLDLKRVDNHLCEAAYSARWEEAHFLPAVLKQKMKEHMIHSDISIPAKKCTIVYDCATNF